VYRTYYISLITITLASTTNTIAYGVLM